MSFFGFDLFCCSGVLAGAFVTGANIGVSWRGPEWPCGVVAGLEETAPEKSGAAIRPDVLVL